MKKQITSLYGDTYEIEPIYTDCGLSDCIHCKSQCQYGVKYTSQILGGY